MALGCESITKKYVWSKLPKKDKAHLKEMKIYYKWEFLKQVEFLKSEFKKGAAEGCICWECIDIAKKLGLWESE